VCQQHVHPAQIHAPLLDALRLVRRESLSAPCAVQDRDVTFEADTAMGDLHVDAIVFCVKPKMPNTVHHSPAARRVVRKKKRPESTE
jgi:hypothetical protein